MGSTEEACRESDRAGQLHRISLAKFVAALVGIICIKLAFLLLDSHPAYYLGDSQAYIGTALIHYIPPDRSFMYGLLIRAIVVPTHSLELLIVFQVLLSALASGILLVLLVRIFRVRFWIAVSCAVLCAIEPMQLSMERFVLTETAANFLFAVYFALTLVYIRVGSIWTLAAAQAVGILLITVRISFFPQVLVLSVVVPLLSPCAAGIWNSLVERFRYNRPSRRQLRVVALHLFASLLVSQVLLSAYGHLNGRLSHRPPSIFYDRGDFLLTAFLPIIEPADCRNIAGCRSLFDGLKFDYHSTRNRMIEHFANGEVIGRVHTLYPDPTVANGFESRIVIRAMERNPIAVGRLLWTGFSEFWDHDYFLSRLKWDQGIGRPLPSDFVDVLHGLGVADPRGGEPSLTKTWAQDALPWYCFVLCALLCSPLLFLSAKRIDFAVLILCVLSAYAFFEGATLAVEYPTARFLTSAAWLTLLMLGIATERVTNRFASHTMTARNA